jgi:type I restriction enzyme S subunit
MSVPKLRFEEFNGDWLSLKIKNLVKSLDAGVSVNSEDIAPENNQYSVLKTSCISSGYFEESERKRVLQQSEIERLKEPVLDDSILMSRMNTPLLVGMNSYVLKAPAKTFLPDRLWQLKINEDRTVTRWLAFYLGSDQGLNQIRDLASGTSNSMKNITKTDVMNLDLFVPSKEEQTQIASFLSAVDEKISQLTQKHQLLSQYKQGLMQKLFSQQLRFKADDGSEFEKWEKIILNDVSDVRDGTHDSPKYVRDGYALITSKNLKNGKLDFSDINYISRQDFESINKRSKVDIGDIIFGMIGTIGNPVLLKTDNFAIKNVALIKQKKELLNTFLIQYLNTDLFEKQVRILNAGNTQKFLALGQIRSLNILKPCLAEQTKIANFLSAIDQKIEVVVQQIEQAKQWKKGLLQQMFV